MKKVLIGLVVVVLLVIGGGVYVYMNLDNLVKNAIESAGTRALGTEVSVDSVALDLPAGTASINGFRIANPQGFSDGDMLRFDELSVSLDVQNLGADSIHVFSVVSRSPFILYESRDGSTNVDAIAARFDSGEPAVEADNPAAQRKVRVDSIEIEDIRGTLMSDRLPNALEVDLGDIRLQNLEGTPADLASQAMTPILAQLGRRAAEALLRNLDNGVIQETLDNVSEQAGEALDRVGDRFRRDEE